MAPPAANGTSTNKYNTQGTTTSIMPTSANSDDSESQNSLNGYSNHDSKKSHLTRFRQHMAQDVHEDWADVVLLVLSFISGMVDSAVFNTWSCFVSMQTGTSLHPLLPSTRTAAKI